MIVANKSQLVVFYVPPVCLTGGAFTNFELGVQNEATQQTRYVALAADFSNTAFPFMEFTEGTPDNLAGGVIDLGQIGNQFSLTVYETDGVNRNVLFYEKLKVV